MARGRALGFGVRLVTAAGLLVLTAMPSGCEALGGKSVAEHRSGAASDAERAAAHAEVAAVLDDFHVAASRADGAAYFAHFLRDAVFLGTDASERWSVEQFRAYAEPFFSKGQGWTYAAIERHVTVAPCGGLAWFDERLGNAKYGEARGSGVLRRVAERDAAGDDVHRWRIAQYVLSFPVPNELAEDLAARVRGLGR